MKSSMELTESKLCVDDGLETVVSSSPLGRSGISGLCLMFFRKFLSLEWCLKCLKWPLTLAKGDCLIRRNCGDLIGGVWILFHLGPLCGGVGNRSVCRWCKGASVSFGLPSRTNLECFNLYISSGGSTNLVSLSLCPLFEALEGVAAMQVVRKRQSLCLRVHMSACWVLCFLWWWW